MRNRSNRSGSSQRRIDHVPAGRLVIAGTIALLALGWIALYHLIEREKTEAIEKAAATNASLTHAFGEHVRSGMKLVDTYSWQLATEVEHRGIEGVKLRAHWRQIDAALPFIQQIGIIGPDGKLVASVPEFPPVDLADREHFRFHRDHTGAGLFIATPVRFRSSGKWTIPLSRRLYTPRGGFAGVLVVGLDAEYFSSYLSGVSLGDRDAISIARSDGVLLVRRVSDRIQYAETATELPWFKAAQPARGGWSVLESRTDGVPRVAAYESMPDYPLVLALGTPLEQALAPVLDRLPIYYTVAGGVSVALLLAAFMIALLFHRQAAANRGLAESEARFRSLTALSSDWYWEQDKDFRMTLRSDDEREKSGAAHRPEVGARRWDVPALNLSDADWANHRAALERHESFRDFEIERATNFGGTTWISLSGEPVFAPDGGFRGYRGVGRNVTERKRAERLLALEHAVNRCLSDADSAAAALKAVIRCVCEMQGWVCGRYYRLDEEAGVLRFAEFWSMPEAKLDAFIARSRAISYAPGDGLIGRAWQSGKALWVTDITSDPRARQSMAPQAGLRGVFLFPVVAEDKVIGVLGFNSRHVREPDDHLLEAVRAIGNQIGQYLQRKQAEEALREAEERSRSLLMVSPDGIWIHCNCRIEYVNSTLTRMLGYDSTEEIIGREIFEMLPPEEHAAVRVRQEQLRSGLRTVPLMEIVMLKRDGSALDVEVASSSYQQKDAFWIITIIRDITKRKHAEREILRLNAELEQRVSERTTELESTVREMETFTYTVAHDLRSPLRAMNGYCEILLQDYASMIPDEGLGYLRRVAANSSRLGLLIDDLLAFSRCSHAEFRTGPVNMESLLREVIAEHVPGDCRARICVGALPPCHGDASLVGQVVANLVLNAVKYSRNELTPTIEIGHSGSAYFVRDNGVGFDMQYANKLFGVFNRLHRSEEFEGTGVGLAIVKRIIDRHRGRVWAQAEPGKGATFFFTLD